MKKINFDISIITNLFLFCITVFIVALSFSAEYFMGAIPCVLCLYQRYIYMSILGVSLFKLITVFITKNEMNIVLYIQTFLCLLLFGISFSHSLMQRNIIDAPQSCYLQMEQLQILNYTKTLCQEGPKVLGLYSAELSFIMSVLFLMILYLSFRLKNIY